MASRTGILSNANYKEECLDYKALPLGFMNSEYSGNLSNPFLQGIKTAKYQRAAPKPASADIVATSIARLMVGNRQVNARNILNNFQREAKEYKPPPVNLSALNRMNKDKQAVSILPRASSGQTIGSAITKQTIGLNSEDLVALQQRYGLHYTKLPRQRQLEIGDTLVRQLERDGIVLKDYEIQSQVLRAGQKTAVSSGNETARIANIERAISAFHLRNSSVNLDEVFGLIPKDLGSSSREEKPSSSVAGETFYSEAPTQQGIAQSATTPTQPEIEKK